MCSSSCVFLLFPKDVMDVLFWGLLFPIQHMTHVIRVKSVQYHVLDQFATQSKY